MSAFMHQPLATAPDVIRSPIAELAVLCGPTILAACRRLKRFLQREFVGVDGRQRLLQSAPFSGPACFAVRRTAAGRRRGGRRAGLFALLQSFEHRFSRATTASSRPTSFAT